MLLLWSAIQPHTSLPTYDINVLIGDSTEEVFDDLPETEDQSLKVATLEKSEDDEQMHDQQMQLSILTPFGFEGPQTMKLVVEILRQQGGDNDRQ